MCDKHFECFFFCFFHFIQFTSHRDKSNGICLQLEAYYNQIWTPFLNNLCTDWTNFYVKYKIATSATNVSSLWTRLQILTATLSDSTFSILYFKRINTNVLPPFGVISAHKSALNMYSKSSANWQQFLLLLSRFSLTLCIRRRDLH